jgi:succinoglycan biosynthesis protein ExoV
MRIFYYKDHIGNFGDDLNEWLWKEVEPGLPDDADDGKLLVGIGTIIGLPLPPGNWRKLVVGSGIGYLNVPKLDDSWEFLAVRGPLTAKALGLPPEAAVTDGAALLRTLPRYAKNEKTRKGVIFMPHLSSMGSNWEKVCEKAGIEYVSPQQDSKLILEKIQSAELVLADAMHAAITADALRVPWVPLAISNNINTFKWVDWCLSLKLPYKPTYMPSSSVTEFLGNLSIRYLSKPYRAPMSVVNTISTRPDQAEAVLLEHYKKRYGGGAFFRFKENLHHNYVTRALRLIQRTALRKPWAFVDRMMIAHAAKKLRKAAEGPSYLSDEKVLDDAILRLQAILKQLV